MRTKLPAGRPAPPAADPPHAPPYRPRTTPTGARAAAIAALPDIARDVLPDGDRRDFVSSVRDEAGEVIFTATLSLVAQWVG